MSTHTATNTIVLISAVLLGATSPCLLIRHAEAAQELQEADSVELDYENARKDALQWLGEYMRTQVLFDQDTLEKLYQQVEKMSPGELKEWLAKTQEVRRVLDSPEWAETETWLQDFLRKQAYYSDEEVAEFRANAGKMTPDELIDLLESIEKKHTTMMWMSASSRKTRDTQVALAEQREAQRARARAAVPSSATRRPLFGSSQGHAARQHQSSRQYRAPLISSDQVARDTVRRTMFGGRYYRW